MMPINKIACAALMALLLPAASAQQSFAAGKKQSQKQETAAVRLLYWNIQNGMWDGQGDNYGRFVDWVSSQNADICVWCEGQSIFKTDSKERMEEEDRFLVDGWKKLARRYGHKHVYVGGHRDNYPQVITSRLPIKNVSRIVGEAPDSVVSHGAGWATVKINGQLVNIVTLHTWPQGWTYKATDKKKSKKEHGGDAYRKKELEYICNHTILTHADAAQEYWVMLGDHNAKSVVDNFKYNFPADTAAFWAHNYIRENTPYIDVVAGKHPGVFRPSTHGKKNRIDFIYVTPALYEKVTAADIVYDEYTEPVRDPQKLSNFWRPSDHRPIIMDLKF